MKNRCTDDTPTGRGFLHTHTHTHTRTQKWQTKCDLCVSEKRTFHAHSNSGTAAASAAGSGWAMLRIQLVHSNNEKTLVSHLLSYHYQEVSIANGTGVK